MANKEVLDTIDAQIISWIEQLDKLTEQRKQIDKRIVDIEGRLSSMKQARRALATEWGEPNIDPPIPLKYTSEGVTGAIEELLINSKEGSLTVDEIVSRLKNRGFNFEQKNPRRVVNMALINGDSFIPDGKGKYSFDFPDLSFLEEASAEEEGDNLQSK